MVQSDLDAILAKYYEISRALGDDFFAEFEIGVRRVCQQPRFFHFDSTGLRRYSFERFPYHFLYDIQRDYLRIWVVRHDRREPRLGTRRFPGPPG